LICEPFASYVPSLNNAEKRLAPCLYSGRVLVCIFVTRRQQQARPSSCSLETMVWRALIGVNRASLFWVRRARTQLAYWLRSISCVTPGRAADGRSLATCRRGARLLGVCTCLLSQCFQCFHLLTPIRWRLINANGDNQGRRRYIGII